MLLGHSDLKPRAINVDNDGNGSTRFVISDTGTGIEAENIPKIVEPFAQVANIESRPHEGTGLGLTLAKSLTELHGGSLEIESEFGAWTNVSVRIPKRAPLNAA